MEPSYGPRVSPRDEESQEPAALQSITEPSFEVYESLDRDISRSKKGSKQRNRSSSFFGVEGLSGLPLKNGPDKWKRMVTSWKATNGPTSKRLPSQATSRKSVIGWAVTTGHASV